jgi:ABC-2 type transport system permease protein
MDVSYISKKSKPKSNENKFRSFLYVIWNSITNMFIMIELELRRLKHERTELYFRAVQPILWLVVYGPVMSSVHAIETGGVSYIDYITPGILIQSTTFVSIFYGLQIVWERDSGILKKLLVAPVQRYSVVIGRSMASGVRSLFQMLILMPVALLIGVNFVPNFFYWILALLIIFFASGGFAAISIFVASFMKSRERFMGIGQAIIFPLFFLSSALYPINLMPPILQQIAVYNPLTYVVDAIRGLLITGSIENLGLDLLVIVLFDALMFLIAALSFKKIIQ